LLKKGYRRKRRFALTQIKKRSPRPSLAVTLLALVLIALVARME
jgi:hypothetical protein